MKAIEAEEALIAVLKAGITTSELLAITINEVQFYIENEFGYRKTVDDILKRGD